MKTKLQTMIVSQSISWQRILFEYLSRNPLLIIDDVVDGCLSAAQRITNDYPELLVIDCTVSGDDIRALIKHVKSVNSKTQIMIIADTHEQKRKFNRCGADFVVSSFSYEAQIEDALRAIRGKILDTTGNV
jgi:DNA-binding NtrC family response regulator